MKKGMMFIAVAATIMTAACSSKADKNVSDEEMAVEAVAEAEATDGVDMPEAEAQPAAANMEVKVDTTGYKTTASGLKYKVVKEGTGKQPASSSAVVKVHYAGKHMNGETFDSSYDRGETIEFPLNRVIPGWTEGVQLMKEGAKYQFIIPSELGYGPTGTPGGPIAPNEDLYFDIELFEVK